MRYLFWLFTFFISFLMIHRPINVAQFSLPERPGLLNETITPIQGMLVTVKEVSELAVVENLDVKMARLELAGKAADVMSAKSRFDAEFSADARYDWNKEEQASIVFGNKTITGNVDARLTKKIPLGTEVSLFFNEQRNSTDSAFASLNPNYESHTGIDVRQPLLENFFGFVDRGEVKIAKLALKSFKNETLNKIEASVFKAREAYWQYVRRIELAKLAEQNYQIAKQFLEITQQQFETGLKEEADLYAVEANLRKRTDNLLRAHLDAKLALNELKLQLHHENDFIPEESLTYQPMEVDFDKSMAGALDHRRDYQAELVTLEAQGVQVKMNKSRLWPSLDFVGTFGGNGLDRDQKNAPGKAFSFQEPHYAGAFELRMPLENREARARFQKAESDLGIAQLQLEKLMQQIYIEIENAYKTLNIKGEIVKQAAEIETLEQKKLEAEQAQFKVGRSSSKTIIDYQSDLVEAQIGKINTLTEYQIARDQMLLVQNQLLASLGLTDESAL